MVPINRRNGPPDIPFPPSYRLALANRFTSAEIEALLAIHRPSFFYGSLMFPTVVNSVTRQEDLRRVAKHMTPARISGYRRLAVQNVDYPALVPTGNPRDQVQGMLGFGFTQVQRTALDYFEGGLYNRHGAKVTVELDTGESLELDADVYVWNQEVEVLEDASERTWTVQGFLRSDFYRSFQEGIEELEG